MPHRIIIVGGSIGGTITGNDLATKLYPKIRSGKVEVLMLSNTPWYYYKPAFMYIAFDSFFKNELRCDGDHEFDPVGAAQRYASGQLTYPAPQSQGMVCT